jgi:DNA-binding PadR family transcriptional regulator
MDISIIDMSASRTLALSPMALHILLALVDRDRHGLGIADEVESFTRGRVALGPGTLYGTIKRLLEAGLIEEPAAAPRDDRDDPRRRYYRITATGRRVLADETSALAHVVRAARVKRVL